MCWVLQQQKAESSSLKMFTITGFIWFFSYSAKKSKILCKFACFLTMQQCSCKCAASCSSKKPNLWKPILVVIFNYFYVDLPNINCFGHCFQAVIERKVRRWCICALQFHRLNQKVSLRQLFAIISMKWSIFVFFFA